MEEGVAKDLDGNILDQNKTLSELGVLEITFYKEESGEEVDDDIDLDVVSKVKGIDSAHVDNLSEFMMSGYLLEGDTLETQTDKDKDYTRRRLLDICDKMKNKHTGVPVRSRRLLLRNYENCFIASEAVDWLLKHLNISRNDAVALGKGLEKEGLINHVTFRYNFDDSKELFFRFTGLANIVEEVPIITPRDVKGQDQRKDQRGFHQKFWEPPPDIEKKLKRNSLKTTMFLKSLTSYVPSIVLRTFLHSEVPKPTVPPFSEKFPAAVLFADISGFTPLTERLARHGSRGVEKLTHHLNEYFGRIINLILNHGGDIVKFAGDALVAIWPTSHIDGLGYSTLLAAQCSLSLKEHLSAYDADGANLTLHIGVGAGEIWGIVVGGVQNHMEFLIAGDPMDQVAKCEEAAKPGEVYISREAVVLIQPFLELSIDTVNKKGHIKRKKYDWSSIEKHDIFRLDKINNPVDLPTSVLIPHFKKLKQCISPFVQPAVLSHLNSGSPDHFLAELRTVSVIFVNLGLNFQSSQLETLQNAVKLMQESVYAYEGTIRQFIIDDKGSVLIAALGLPPFSHEDDPCRAIQTAMRIRKVIKALGLETSIGVTTGKAFCGAVGSEERREYAVVGDIVNLSARLMSKADGDILCDKETCMASKSLFTFKTHRAITVKGKSEPIEVFTPLHESRGRTTLMRNKSSRSALIRKERFMSLRNLTVSTEKLIGKEQVVELLRNQVDWIKNPSEGKADARFTLIDGSPGSGKSIILNNFVKLFESKSLRTAIGTAYSIESSTAYFAWRDIFSVLFQYDSLNESISKKDKVQAYVEKCAPDMVELLPLLNNVIGVDFIETSKTKQMSGQLRSEKLEVLLLKMLEASGIKIFAFENAQWLDSASWRLIQAAVLTLKHTLIIACTRTFADQSTPVEVSQLASSANSTVLKLRDLNQSETAELIAIRIGSNSVPDKLSEIIAEKSGGNPLLIVELASALLDAKKIEVTAQGECRVLEKLPKELTSVGIPQTLRSLITSKVDRLPQTQLMILKVASVIGRVFEIDLLQEIMVSTFHVKIPEDGGLLNDVLELETLEFISVKNEDPLSYTFQQNITQEVVYELMLYSQRQQLHRKIAEWYENNMSDQPAIIYPTLAHHYKLAEVMEQAIVYFSKSGEQALSTYANREAVNFFTETLDLQEKTNMDSSINWYVLSWKRQLGQAYYNLGLLEKASVTLESALTAINEPIRIKVGQELLNKLKFRKNSDSSKKERKKKVNSATISSQSVLTREHILILLTIAKVNYYECKRDVVTYCNMMALKRSIEMGLTKEMCESYGSIILTCGMHGKHDLAQMYIEEGINLSQNLKNTDIEPLLNVLQTAGMYYTGISKWDRAQNYFDEAIVLALETGNARRIEESYIFLGVCYFLQGKIKESLEINVKALESSERRGDVQTQILAYMSHAQIELALGKHEKAMDALKTVETMAGRSEGYKLDFATELNYHTLMASIYVSQGDYELAYRTADTIMKFLDESVPTAYFAFTGYMTTPEIFCSILQQLTSPTSTWKARPSVTPSVLQQKIQKSLKHLHAFSKIFTFAEPRLMFCHGLYESLIGKNDKALSNWRKCSELSHQRQMLYDEGISLFRIGKCTDFKDKREVVEEKLRAYDKAVDILSSIGAVYTNL